MTLVKYDKQMPVTSTSPVDKLVNEIFGQDIGRFFGSDGFRDHSPRVNITESNDEYLVEMLAPGFDKKDLHIEMVDETLSIRGEITEEADVPAGRWKRREFKREAFERSFVLPQSVQLESIKAKFKNGVLQLTIPKDEKSRKKTRQISIS